MLSSKVLPTYTPISMEVEVEGRWVEVVEGMAMEEETKLRLNTSLARGPGIAVLTLQEDPGGERNI